MARIATFVVSDLHVGTHFCKQKPNPFDDFPVEREQEFSCLLHSFVASHQEYDELHMVINGDGLDILVIPDEHGRYLQVGSEEDAVCKTRIIVASNQVFFGAIRWFLENEKHHVVIAVGNHDMELNWLATQNVLLEAIAPDVEVMSRVTFVDYRDDYLHQIGPVIFHHGHDCDLLNTNPKPPFEVDDAGQQRMISSAGALSMTEVILPVKVWHKATGRELDTFRIFMYYLVHDFEAGLYTEWRYWVFLCKLFIDAVRRRNFMHFFRLAWHISRLAFTSELRDVAFAQKLLRTRGGKVVVMGHTHHAGVHTLDGGMYINTGTWSTLTRYVSPTIRLSWQRFSSFEYFWRRLVHFLKTRERVLRTTLITLFFGSIFFMLGKSWLIAYVAITVIVTIGRLFSPKPHLEEWVRPTFALITYDDQDPDMTLSAGLYIQDGEAPNGYKQFIG